MNDRTSRRALIFGKTYFWLLGDDNVWRLKRVDYEWTD